MYSLFQNRRSVKRIAWRDLSKHGTSAKRRSTMQAVLHPMGYHLSGGPWCPVDCWRFKEQVKEVKRKARQIPEGPHIVWGALRRLRRIVVLLEIRIWKVPVKGDCIGTINILRKPSFEGTRECSPIGKWWALANPPPSF